MWRKAISPWRAGPPRRNCWWKWPGPNARNSSAGPRRATPTSWSASAPAGTGPRRCAAPSPRLPRGDVPAEEVSHEPSDQIPLAFQREVAGVEEMELYRLEVSLVGLGPGRRKNLVVPAP